MAGLEDLYREIILDHYRAPRNRGELPVPPAHRVEGFNPLCGDEVELFLDVEDGIVTDVKIAGQGCSISQASTSMMSAAVKGKPVSEVRTIIRAFKALMSIHESKIGGESTRTSTSRPTSCQTCASATSKPSRASSSSRCASSARPWPGTP